MRPTQKIFGKKLGKARMPRARMTQAQLARAVGVSPDRIGSIEQREVDGIDPARVALFAEAFKMSIDAWLKEFGATATMNGDNLSKAQPLLQSKLLGAGGVPSSRPVSEWIALLEEFAGEAPAVKSEVRAGLGKTLSRVRESLVEPTREQKGRRAG